MQTGVLVKHTTGVCTKITDLPYRSDTEATAYSEVADSREDKTSIAKCLAGAKKRGSPVSRMWPANSIALRLGWRRIFSVKLSLGPIDIR